MSAVIAHWRSLPARNRFAVLVCLAMLLASLIMLVSKIRDIVTEFSAARPEPTLAHSAETNRQTQDNPEAVRASVWNKSEPLLEQANRQAAQALGKHLASIHAFLEQRKPGARAFAERMLGLRGKWEIVKAQISSGGDQEYAAYLDQAFRESVFIPDDLEQAVASAVRGYLAELESIEDELLVRLRADLGDDELPRTVIPALDSDQALRSHYRALSQRVAQDLRSDLAIVAGRELFLWQATNVATDLTLKAGAAVAARLGVSGTILAAGAASTWRTLGVGLVVAFVLDAVVNRIIKAAGYDAEERVAQRVAETLGDLGRTITDGDPAARTTLEQLKAMQGGDPDQEVRAACAEAIASIEAGTRLYGLRGELSKIAAARASLRRETLRRLIHESEVTP
jgi:hypothetical protein